MCPVIALSPSLYCGNAPAKHPIHVNMRKETYRFFIATPGGLWYQGECYCPDGRGKNDTGKTISTILHHEADKKGMGFGASISYHLVVRRLITRATVIGDRIQTRHARSPRCVCHRTIPLLARLHLLSKSPMVIVRTSIHTMASRKA